MIGFNGTGLEKALALKACDPPPETMICTSCASSQGQ